MKKIFNFANLTYSQKFFTLFLIFSALMWTLIPTSYYQSLHLDPAETLMWGSTFNLGNAKHPPMSGYMLYYFCSLFNFSNFSIFLASQICVTFGFIYVYKLARCFYDRDRSVMACLLITFYFIYNYETPKFNANIPHMLFIPMMCYYFYRGVTANKLHHWVLLAVSGACAILSKYYAGIVFVPFLAYMLCDKNARRVIASYKPYVAGGVFLLLLAPHLYHLYKTEFLVFDYISHGGVKQYGYFSQIFVMAGAIIAPLLCMSLAAVLTYILSEKRIPFKSFRIANWSAFKYSAFVIGGQAVIILLMACANQRMETMWTFPMYFCAGILICSFYPAESSEKTIRNFAVLAVIFAVIIMSIDLIYSNTKSSFRRHLPKGNVRHAAEKFYFQELGTSKIPFIIGDIWHASMLQNTYKYKIKACPDMDPILISLHKDIIKNHGALIITPHPKGAEENIKKHFGYTPIWHKHEFPYQAKFGKKKMHKIYFAILPATK